MTTNLQHTPYKYAKADRIETLLSLFAVTVAALIGFTVGQVVAELDKPNCPTEDSCVVDYHDHEWHITEVTP